MAHEVTNIGSDRDQLHAMSRQAQEAIGVTSLTVVADRGYFKGEEILACTQAGINVIAGKNLTSNASTEGRLGKADFFYDASTNEAIACLRRAYCLTTSFSSRLFLMA